MSRLPAFVFAALALATAGAFFVVQHLKVSTPLLDGFPRPDPAVINPRSGVVCGPPGHRVDHRVMRISFYLLHRSDDVDVYMIDQRSQIVATLASDLHMQGGAHRRRAYFTWDGREDDGKLAPDGTYFVRVDLKNQGRTVVISPVSGGPPSPVRVDTHAPRPVVSAVSPQLVPQSGSLRVSIRYRGTEGHPGLIKLYRTDQPGGPRLVKSFPTPVRGGLAVWDGLIHGRPAPAGIYLVGLDVTDAACNTGRFPPALPPAPASTRGAGVTIRYLAAEPPLTPAMAGTRALVYVDSRRRAYRWALRAAGAAQVLAHGVTSNYALSVPLPKDKPGIFELRLRAGAHVSEVPLVAGSPRQAPVLVVLPALSWIGLSPVDETGDGLPSTLSAGDSVSLSRPLVQGLPAGLGDEVALVRYLAATHRGFELTTDLALAQLGARTAAALDAHRGVILAGSERWLDRGLAAALASYVRRGGHVLSLGLASLRAYVTLSSSAARAPSGQSATDAFGLRHGRFVARDTGLVAAISDGLGLFAQSGGLLPGFSAYEPITGAAAPARLVSAAGTSSSAFSIAGATLGQGSVVEIGLPGFASALHRNLDARELFAGIWSLLAG